MKYFSLCVILAISAATAASPLKVLSNTTWMTGVDVDSFSIDSSFTELALDGSFLIVSHGERRGDGSGVTTLTKLDLSGGGSKPVDLTLPFLPTREDSPHCFTWGGPQTMVMLSQNRALYTYYPVYDCDRSPKDNYKIVFLEIDLDNMQVLRNSSWTPTDTLYRVAFVSQLHKSVFLYASKIAQFDLNTWKIIATDIVFPWDQANLDGFTPHPSIDKPFVYVTWCFAWVYCALSEVNITDPVNWDLGFSRPGKSAYGSLVVVPDAKSQDDIILLSDEYASGDETLLVLHTYTTEPLADIANITANKTFGWFNDLTSAPGNPFTYFIASAPYPREIGYIVRIENKQDIDFPSKWEKVAFSKDGTYMFLWALPQTQQNAQPGAFGLQIVYSDVFQQSMDLYLVSIS